jgi:hypothetical protein
MNPMTQDDYYALFPHMPASAQSLVEHLRTLAGQYAVSCMPEMADECKGEYLNMCSDVRNKLNEEYESYWGSQHTAAANTALPEDGHELEGGKTTEQASSATNVNTEVNSSFTPIETTQVGEMK